MLDVSPGSEYVSDFRLWIRLCFFYYFLHFELIKFRSSRSKTPFKKEAFKSFSIFTGKHLCWSLFVIKLPAQTAFFIEHLPWLLFKAMFETCQNFTMKNEKGFYYVALASLLITWIMPTIEQAVSTSDNDQVKPAGKDYFNVKPV